MNSEKNEAKLSMKWYKFSAYFFLFLSALWYLGSGIKFLLGKAYKEDTERFYRMFDGLKNLDVFTGIFMITLAFFSVYTAVRLIKRRKDSLGALIILYVATILFSSVYLVGVNRMLPYIYLGTANTSLYWILICASIVLIPANAVYFHKRKQMFLN